MKALSKALKDKLPGSALDNFIHGRLYNTLAPETAEYPHCVFLDISPELRDRTFSETFIQKYVQFSVRSSDSSSEEAEDIADAIETLYDEASDLSVTGYTVVWIRSTRRILLREVVPTKVSFLVWHIAIDFSILLER